MVKIVNTFIAPIIGVLILETLVVILHYLKRKTRHRVLRDKIDYIIRLDDSTQFIDHAFKCFLPSLITFEDKSNNADNWAVSKFSISRKIVSSTSYQRTDEHPCIHLIMNPIDLTKNQFIVQELIIVFYKKGNNLFLLKEDKHIFSSLKTIERNNCKITKESIYGYNNHSSIDKIQPNHKFKTYITDIAKSYRVNTFSNIYLLGYILLDELLYNNIRSNSFSFIKLSNHRNKFYSQIETLKDNPLIKRHIINCEDIIRN